MNRDVFLNGKSNWSVLNWSVLNWLIGGGELVSLGASCLAGNSQAVMAERMDEVWVWYARYGWFFE